MDARRRIAVALLATGCVLLGTGANYRSQNFVVSAQDPEFAREVARVAEIHRRELAIAWLGDELPPWPQPCSLKVTLHRDAFGQTSFAFDGPSGESGIPFGWEMEVNGSPERILDSVLPHEITHTILATHFRRRLPRWLDEGASSTCEHVSETGKQERNLIVFLTEGRGIPFNRMFRMMEYPRDQRDMLALYAQGLSVVRFLLHQGEERDFLAFATHGLETEDWDGAIRRVYGFRDLSDLQVTWNEWVRQGSPDLAARPELASTFVPAVRDAERNAAVVAASAEMPATGERPGVRPAPLPIEPSGSAVSGAAVSGSGASAALVASRGTADFRHDPLGADLTDSGYYRRTRGEAERSASLPEAGRRSRRPELGETPELIGPRNAPPVEPLPSIPFGPLSPPGPSVWR